MNLFHILGYICINFAHSLINSIQQLLFILLITHARTHKETHLHTPLHNTHTHEEWERGRNLNFMSFVCMEEIYSMRPPGHK